MGTCCFTPKKTHSTHSNQESRRRSRDDPGRRPLFGTFTKCVIAGSFVVFGTFYYLILNDSSMQKASTRSPVARAQADMRTIAVAVDSYYVDEKAYPIWAAGQAGANSDLPYTHPSYSVPTFAVQTGSRPEIYTLTTPVSYVASFVSDPFTRLEGSSATYAYWAGDCAHGWIIFSPGRDRVYNIVPEKDFNPRSHAISNSLIEKTYDASNGTNSNGDIWLSSQYECYPPFNPKHLGPNRIDITSLTLPAENGE